MYLICLQAVNKKVVDCHKCPLKDKNRWPNVISILKAGVPFLNQKLIINGAI